MTADAATVGVRPSGRRRFSPGDVLRLLIGLGLAVIGLLLTSAGRETMRGVETDLARGLARLPNRVEDGMLAVAQLLASVVPAVAVGYLLIQRRFRLLLQLVVAAVVAALAMVVVEALLYDERLSELLEQFDRGDGGLFARWFPSSWYVALATAAVTAAGPWVSRRWRRAAWVGVGVLVVLRLAVGAAPALDVILVVGVGITVGSLTLLLMGSPSAEPEADDLAEALRRTGLPTSAVVPADRAASSAYHVTAFDGRRLFVKVRAPQERDADLLNRLYRAARFRDVQVTRPFGSIKRQVEHEALLLHIARRAGVQCPPVHGVGMTADGSAFLAEERIDAARASPTDLADPATLAETWRQVALLHRAGIAHRRLSVENVMVGPDGSAWLVDFDEAETAASGRELAKDVADLLVESTLAAGPDQAVSAAVEAIGADAVASSLPLLQPLALSRPIQRRLKASPQLLPELIKVVRDRTGAPAVELARLERVPPRTLLIVVASTLAFYSLLPQLANLGDTADALRDATWGWLVGLLVASAMTYVFAAVALVGAVTDPVPFTPALRAGVAASFASLVGPAGSGGMALGVRFLERTGVNATQAGAAIALNAVAGLFVHVVLMIGFFVWTGRAGVGGFSLPDANILLLVVAIVIGLVGVVVVVRPLRDRVVVPARRALAGAAVHVSRVFRSPANVVALFGGSALLTIAYVAAMFAAVEAFGGDLTFHQIGAAYLAAVTIATFAPTPGGLGAVESATIALLTGFGLQGGIAVSAVLTFRLATFWLPILPGWLLFTWMQRHGEL
jgi:uncharacterized membrane protein YbhN (UPF0104 family)/tRNA A-37 threonylcarbamoyl transferase component Bud32